MKKAECDLYLGLKSVTDVVALNPISQHFPNLALDNAFISGPASGLYNCF